jgi:hypothetical protein
MEKITVNSRLSAFQVASNATYIARVAELRNREIIRRDEDSQTGIEDEYLGQPGRFAGAIGPGTYAKGIFDVQTGQVSSSRIEQDRASSLKIAPWTLETSKTSIGTTYRSSGNFGLTSTIVTIDQASKRWTVQENILGLPLGPKHEFGDLTQPSWTEHWPVR